MTSDEFEADATPCKTVQRPVFRAAIDTPEPRAAEVCEPGAELKPQQSEQPKDVSDLAVHADMVSLSGHKMYGPQGIGALYIRRDLQDQIEPLIYGGGQQAGLRSGTVPMPLCVGMGAAAELLAGHAAFEERTRVALQLDSFVRHLQRGYDSLAVNGSIGDRRHPGNSNVRFDGFDAQDILGTLQPRLAASTGAACASGIPEPSHVLGALGLTETQSKASIRFSFGRFTTDGDIEASARFVLEALDSLSVETVKMPL